MHVSVVISLLLFFVFQPLQLSAQSTICPNQPEISVNAADTTTIHNVCNSSEKAIAVLKSFGLYPKRQINIKIVEEEIENHGYMAYGSYDSRTDTIRLMSYQYILRHHKKPIMYGEFFDPVHYEGAIAHEIAHAVYNHHALNLSPGTAPQEYLAHAVQLAVLPERRRAAIIAKKDTPAWESGDAISDIYMALEPTGFAVKSYKHLTTTKNPQEFIHILLNSKWFYVYIP